MIEPNCAVFTKRFGVPKFGVIERILPFGARFETHAFVDRERSCECDVHPLHARAVHGIASHISEREGRGCRKRRPIEPLRGVLGGPASEALREIPRRPRGARYLKAHPHHVLSGHSSKRVPAGEPFFNLGH